MDTLPCQGCKGMCCGPVPVTDKELKAIKKKVKAMPKKHRLDLKQQPRHFGTCLFYDLEGDKCGIYSARPDVCQKFGHYKHLVCFRKPEAATQEDRSPQDKPVGLLTIDFTWKDFA